ncbi:MAG: GspE/PulE family protein, partial [Thermodesulfobacteriota bacterium]
MNKDEQEPQFTERSKKRVKNVVLRFIEGTHPQDPGQTEAEQTNEETPRPSPDPAPALEQGNEFLPSILEEEVTPVDNAEDDHETHFMVSEAKAQEMRDKPLGEILLQISNLERNQLEEGLKALEERGGRLGDILVKLGYITESQVLYGLSLQMGLPFLHDLEVDDVDPELCSALPIHFARKHGILPIKRDGDGVSVATSNPLDIYPLDDVRILLNQEVKPVVMPPRAVIDAINRVYDRDANAAQQIIEDFDEDSLDIISSALEEPADLLDASDEAPVIRLVNSTLFQAVKQRASDIHIEPFERELVVRYRIDGILYNVLTPPKRIQPSITSRVKIMAGLNIAEKRLPQDGRIRVTIAGKNIDIRVSIIPTAHGERIVMRLLDKTSVLLKLEDIGFSADKLKIFNRLIHRPHGIILLTGPTGSGKTTTLYAALTRINSPDKNIITVEDPIEYQIRGIGQIQVNPKINLTFANGLRSILRQDP